LRPHRYSIKPLISRDFFKNFRKWEITDYVKKGQPFGQREPVRTTPANMRIPSKFLNISIFRNTPDVLDGNPRIIKLLAKEFNNMPLREYQRELVKLLLVDRMQRCNLRGRFWGTFIAVKRLYHGGYVISLSTRSRKSLANLREPLVISGIVMSYLRHFRLPVNGAR
jgi:hypothetical protein